MYLAKLQNGFETSYQIRESYRTEENSFLYRIVYNLGNDPRQFITSFEDHIALFNSDLVEAVSADTRNNGEAILEHLLWDFLPTATKRRLAMFQIRKNHRTGPLSMTDREEIAQQIHLFDRRRLYYLRYGAVDQSRLSRLHEKCCRPLLGQSRDEREYYFTAEETALQPGKYLQYVYAIFNLQKHFYQSYAPWLPESLAFDEMAEHFQEELCRLNRGSTILAGRSNKQIFTPPPDPIPDHVLRLHSGTPIFFYGLRQDIYGWSSNLPLAGKTTEQIP